MIRKRYALCGLSSRGIYQFAFPLLGMHPADGPNFSDRAELVGILDTDRERVEGFNGKAGRSIPYYPPDALARMISETRPDTVLIASPDDTHAGYIVGAMEGGCDVIVEKPMVIDCEQVRQVQAAEKRTGRRLLVALNFRYVPTHKRLKRMIAEGRLGRIVNVEFTYNLDTRHGSSYFYRWNRERAKSGGLSVHKCCHHFDLVNWWLNDVPEWVFAFGGLNYYGAKGALRPRDAHGRPLDPVAEKRACPIFRKHYADRFSPESNDISGHIYPLPNEAQYSGSRRRYIYDESIDVEDTYSAVMRYRGGALLNYSCNFCTPWEGYILGINGTGGRVEIVYRSKPEPSGRLAPAEETGMITFYPLFGGKEVIEIPPVAGGHGGADYVIQRDLFGGISDESRELALVAGSDEGAVSVAMGEAVWRSAAERRPICLAQLLDGTCGNVSNGRQRDIVEQL